MKQIRVKGLFVFLLITVILFSACGKKSAYDGGSYSSTSYDVDTEATNASLGNSKADSNSAMYDEMISSDTATADVVEEDAATVGGVEGIENSTALTSAELQTLDKIIKTYYLDVETQDFDNLIKNINDKINSLGGYVESSSISGRSFYEDNVTRTGNIVVRIPNDKADEFVNTVDETANVTNNQSSTDNVTLEYVDAQSRIEALKTEQDRLFAILEKAEDLESIITLESRLSDIRYELQNYESQLRVYDNQVKYSTVTLNINEVERITPDTKEKPTFTSRISNGFSDTLYHIGQGFQNFAVWFVVNLPYLLIWGVIIFIIVIIIRRYIKKANQKRNRIASMMNPYPNNTMQQYGRPQDQVNHNQQQSTQSPNTESQNKQ